MGPFANNGADTDHFWTCKVMDLPHYFVNLFLEGGLKPCQAYEAVSVVVAVDGTQIACAPLVDWLQAACTCFTETGVPTEASLLAQMPSGAPQMQISCTTGASLLCKIYLCSTQCKSIMVPNTLPLPSGSLPLSSS